MSQVYSGIVDQSVKNVDGLLMIVNSFVTQMSDAKRLEIINSIGERVNQNWDDLQRFNNQNAMLSLQRARNEDEARAVKAMYGL